MIKVALLGSTGSMSESPYNPEGLGNKVKRHDVTPEMKQNQRKMKESRKKLNLFGLQPNLVTHQYMPPGM